MNILNIIFGFNWISLAYILNGRLDPGILSPWRRSEPSTSFVPGVQQHMYIHSYESLAALPSVVGLRY